MPTSRTAASIAASHRIRPTCSPAPAGARSRTSINLWITPDSANLQPGAGGLDVWDVAAPDDWTFEDYNHGVRDIRAFLEQEGARQTSFAYAENRALLFKGSIFHQTAATRFADGFENRRRNVTMLFRRTQS